MAANWHNLSKYENIENFRLQIQRLANPTDQMCKEWIKLYEAFIRDRNPPSGLSSFDMSGTPNNLVGIKV